MELRVLRYFLLAAREENITKAAELLHVTQPTLSRQLMQLEKELGTKLFHRGQHNITLTNDGTTGGFIMQYTKLGNSELSVSRICLGCMGFGDAGKGQHSWTIDEEHSREIIKRALDLGVNFFDTAIAYQSGTSEQYVGRAIRDFAKREDVVVATKFLPRTEDEIVAGISGQQHIERMLNTSLSNLGLDYVDLYIYHMWDYQTPLYEIMEGLNNMVKAGKARYIGISNCFAWQLAKANALAEREGFTKFVSIQGHYNLIFREEEREMAKICAEDNIAMTPYSLQRKSQ